MGKKSGCIGVSILALLALVPSLDSQDSSDSAGALAAVDRFFETFNSRDAALWARSLHYPHIRKPGVGRPLRPSRPSFSADEYANRFDYSRIIRTGWDHTAVESKTLVHITSDKAHVAALYHRYNERGDKIRTTRVTYLVTKVGERWGVQARFGAGEPHETESNRTQAEAEALEAVEEYLDAFYSKDHSAWESTLHYPFVNVRVGGLDEIKTPAAAAGLDRSRLDARFGECCVSWKSLRVIQSGVNGVNLVAELSRRASGGQLASSFNGLYLVTNIEGRWGVIGHSVIASQQGGSARP